MNDLGHDFENSIHFSISIVAAEADAHGAVSVGERHTHSAEHVRRFKTAGSTGRTGAGADAVLIHLNSNNRSLSYGYSKRIYSMSAIDSCL